MTQPRHIQQEIEGASAYLLCAIIASISSKGEYSSLRQLAVRELVRRQAIVERVT